VVEEIGHFLTRLDHHEELRLIGSCNNLEIGECVEDELEARPLRLGLGKDGCQSMWPDLEIPPSE